MDNPTKKDQSNRKHDLDHEKEVKKQLTRERGRGVIPSTHANQGHPTKGARISPLSHPIHTKRSTYTDQKRAPSKGGKEH